MELGSTTRTKRTVRAVGWAFVVGLAARLLVSQWLPVEPSWDGVIYERAARQLAAGYGYTLRMYDPGWPWADLPTAFYPPGWPATLALLKLLEGPRWLDLVLQSFLGALAIPLAAKLGGAIRGHASARRAAWLVALWPGGWLISASWMGEPLFTLALGCAVLPLIGPRGGHPARLSLASLLFGVAAYVRPTALAIAPFALVARAWTRTSKAKRVAFALAATSLALAAPAPWMARNARRLSAPVVSSSAGANLYVGTLGSRFQRIPAELDCPRGPRELTRDRCRRDHALRRIAADPAHWLALGVGKVAHTLGYEMGPALQIGSGLGWSPPEEHPVVIALIVVCSAYWLALLALALRSRGRRAPRRVVWACVFGVAALHFVFLGGDRYHLPLVPLVAALAASSAGYRWTRVQGQCVLGLVRAFWYDPTVRLKRLTVRNTKLLREVVDIDFTRDGNPRQFTVFVGPNGLCKSTLLQCIAMASVGPEIGNQLAVGVIPSMPDRREDAVGEATVEATFEWRSTPDSAPRDLTSVIEIPEGSRVLRGHARFDAETTEELRDARAKGMGGHLVAGYGVGRHLPAPLLHAESRDASLDRLQSLFEPTHPLIGTNFASRFPNGLARRFALRLREVLVDDGLLPNVKDIELSGAGGAKNASRLVEAHRFRMEVPDLKIPATWLSQGYQQTITWIADLIGHAWIDAGEKEVDPKEMTGLALIDELDLSLHPKWQRELVPALRRAFPKMQFIATTHAPMVLPGFEQDEIRLLSQDAQGSVQVSLATKDPRTLTSGGIYATFFDVRQTYPADVGRALDEYTFIASDPLRTDEEDGRLLSLRETLDEARIDPGFDAVDRAETES